MPSDGTSVTFLTMSENEEFTNSEAYKLFPWFEETSINHLELSMIVIKTKIVIKIQPF